MPRRSNSRKRSVGARKPNQWQIALAKARKDPRFTSKYSYVMNGKLVLPSPKPGASPASKLLYKLAKEHQGTSVRAPVSAAKGRKRSYGRGRARGSTARRGIRSAGRKGSRGRMGSRGRGRKINQYN
jgi:hypothetical protein